MFQFKWIAMCINLILMIQQTVLTFVGQTIMQFRGFNVKWQFDTCVRTNSTKLQIEISTREYSIISLKLGRTYLT